MNISTSPSAREFRALIAYLGILICGLMHAVWRKKELRACACGAAVFAYAVQACFGFSMYITAPFFWIFLELMTAGPENEEDEAAEKSASGGKNGKIKEILTQNEKNI